MIKGNFASFLLFKNVASRNVSITFVAHIIFLVDSTAVSDAEMHSLIWVLDGLTAGEVQSEWRSYLDPGKF